MHLWDGGGAAGAAARCEEREVVAGGSDAAAAAQREAAPAAPQGPALLPLHERPGWLDSVALVLHGKFSDEADKSKLVDPILGLLLLAKLQRVAEEQAAGAGGDGGGAGGGGGGGTPASQAVLLDADPATTERYFPSEFFGGLLSVARVAAGALSTELEGMGLAQSGGAGSGRDSSSSTPREWDQADAVARPPSPVAVHHGAAGAGSARPRWWLTRQRTSDGLRTRAPEWRGLRRSEGAAGSAARSSAPGLMSSCPSVEEGRTELSTGQPPRPAGGLHSAARTVALGGAASGPRRRHSMMGRSEPRHRRAPPPTILAKHLPPSSHDKILAMVREGARRDQAEQPGSVRSAALRPRALLQSTPGQRSRLVNRDSSWTWASHAQHIAEASTGGSSRHGSRRNLLSGRSGSSHRSGRSGASVVAPDGAHAT